MKADARAISSKAMRTIYIILSAAGWAWCVLLLGLVYLRLRQLKSQQVKDDR